MVRVRCGLIVAMSILAATSCVRQPGPPPIARGVLALDGALIIEEFAKNCQDAESPWHAEIAIRGSIHGHRIAEHARAGFAGASARIELGSPNTEPHVVLATRGGEGHSTLLLSDRSRVIEDQSFEVVLERVLGVKVDVRTLSQILLGCHLLEPVGDITAYGEHWRRISGGRNGNEYLYRDSSSEPWRIVTLYYPGEGLQWKLRLDYDDFDDGVARTRRVRGPEAGGVDLTLTLLRLDIRASITDDLFSIAIPPSAMVMTLDELTGGEFFAIPPERH
jgi:hypothetical protein